MRSRLHPRAEATLMQVVAPSTQPPSVTVHDVTAQGLRVRFHESGAGKPLVLVHGFLGDRHVFDDVLVDLARTFRVIAIDLPGFGESEKPNPEKFAYDCDAFAEALLDVLAALGLSRTSVAGHGLGGAIALTLSAHHPAVVENLILIDPLIYEAQRAALLELSTLPLVGRLLFKQVYGRGAFRSFFQHYGELSQVPTARIDRRFALFGTPAARESAHRTLLASKDTRKLRALLPRIRARTLVVWGREDTQTPVREARNLARQLSGARLEVMACGHYPHEEKPAEFAEVIRRFLDGERPTSSPPPRSRRGSR